MKKKIMIIDDEADFCFFLKRNIEASGRFEVDTVSESARAVQQVRLFKPDLILLDVMMPGMSGSDVAAEIKRDENTRSVPIVFLTAIVNEAEVKQNRNCIGGWMYLSKPVQIEELNDLVARLLPEKAERT
ncbi:MAG: response regulator [Candidatus Omnitrophica bacterium]|nr:response regulator [Candidatus Omnitrophota bacterium]